MYLHGHMEDKEVVEEDNLDMDLEEAYMYQIDQKKDMEVVEEDMEVVEEDKVVVEEDKVVVVEDNQDQEEAYKCLIGHNLEVVVEVDNQVVVEEDIVEVVGEDIEQDNNWKEVVYMFVNDGNNHFLLLDQEDNLIENHHYLSSFF